MWFKWQLHTFYIRASLWFNQDTMKWCYIATNCRTLWMFRMCNYIVLSCIRLSTFDLYLQIPSGKTTHFNCVNLSQINFITYKYSSGYLFVLICISRATRENNQRGFSQAIWVAIYNSYQFLWNILRTYIGTAIT